MAELVAPSFRPSTYRFQWLSDWNPNWPNRKVNFMWQLTQNAGSLAVIFIGLSIVHENAFKT